MTQTTMIIKLKSYAHLSSVPNLMSIQTHLNLKLYLPEYSMSVGHNNYQPTDNNNHCDNIFIIPWIWRFAVGWDCRETGDM